MIHLGDITKINGAAVPVVDCIIGGSPCQDLSVAGKRAGLAGKRSGLFMDQIRVTKEMRENDRANGRTGGVRPRYMVWENVPGAFSSNKGRDFAAVLEETVRVVEPQAPDVPVPEKGWPTAGVVVGDGWSVAWRVLDAQFWGVPQRRRRIALVADFGGKSAPEILFECQSVSWHSEPCGTERKDTTGRAGGSPEATGFDGYNGQLTGDVSSTLGVNCGMSTGRNGVIEQKILCLNDQGGSVMSVSDNVTATLRAQEHGHQPCILDMTHANEVVRKCGETAPTLQSRMGTGGNQVPLVFSIGNGQANQSITEGIAGTLNAMHDQQAIFTQGGYGEYKQGCGTLRAAGGDNGGGSENLVLAVDCYNQAVTGDISKPLTSAATDSDHIPCVCRKRIRRLTPLECERLQGFPDHWTDIGTWVDSKGKKRECSDAARYKALGNSIALPPWKWVLKRLYSQYERDATMASCFDGVGGFPWIWEQLNGKGSCLWASEIEEFPIAVTKLRFGESKNEHTG